jgi:hypothetical protein
MYCRRLIGYGRLGGVIDTSRHKLDAVGIIQQGSCWCQGWRYRISGYLTEQRSIRSIVVRVLYSRLNLTNTAWDAVAAGSSARQILGQTSYLGHVKLWMNEVDTCDNAQTQTLCHIICNQTIQAWRRQFMTARSRPGTD